VNQVLNLSKGAAFKPVWLPLDMRFGMTEQLSCLPSKHCDIGVEEA